MWPLFWRSFDLYSLAGFKYLIDQLEEYQTVNNTDGGFVETLRLIAELVIYGDQNDPSIFELFMEKQVMAQFLNILKVNSNSDVALQLLQTLSIMIQSLQSEHAIYYLFSNEYINNLITYPFDFQNEELIIYYISFLRTISGRLDENTISLLVKTQHDAIVSFPLYSEAIKFFNHQDSMICIAVRALTLSIYRVNDDSVTKFITTPPMSGYFSDLVKHIKQNTLKLDALVVRAAQVDDASEIKKMLVSTIEEIDDDLYYLSDILCASVSNLSGLVTQNLLHTLVLPMLLPSLHLSDSNSTQIRALTSLYILSRLLQVVNSKEVVDTIGSAFLCPPMVATTSFNCECDGHSLIRGMPSESTKSVLASGISMAKEQASGFSMVNTNTQTKEQASRISMVNTNTQTENQHIAVKPFKAQCIKVGLLEESEKDRKSNLSPILPSFVSYENYKLVLASLSLLVLLLENKELKISLLEALGILPPKMQCQKLSEVFDSLIRLLCSRPPQGETMWHVGWVFKNILPYLETKLFDHHLNVAYENASFNLLNEINDSCCDLILKTLLAEWKNCKKALEISTLHKDIGFILLPDSQPVVPDGSCSSFIVKERMLGAVKVFILFHQVVNLILRGTFPEIPPLDLIKEFPASSRAKCAGLDSEALKVGVEVNLGDAIPCRIAFEEGKEMHVCMLAVVKGAHGWLLLAEEVLSKPRYGVVLAHAPLAALKPKVDEIHPRWLHLQIRADDLPSFGSKTAGIGRYRTNQMPDGRWTLAFSDEQACKYANLMILDEMAIQKSFVKYALESLLRINAIMKVEETSLKDFSST